ncbi:MAG TPA: hypothetical protein VEA79_08170, partial [Phenylobacterium sp.]|nr:hypothetical protein [Phenylobacterium sp.]
MSGPLIFLSVEVAVVVLAALVAARALMAAPETRAAQLIALIAVNTACSTLLAHQDYGYWIPAAFRIDVG